MKTVMEDAWEYIARIGAGIATMGVSEAVIAAEGSLSEAGCGGQGSNSYGNPGGSPAFGYWEGNKMWAVPTNIQGVYDHGITETSDDDDTGSCPTTHTKGLSRQWYWCWWYRFIWRDVAIPGCASGKDKIVE